jgi:hypothetical protein
VTSGTWLADGRRLAVVDSLSERVVLYRQDGRSLGVVTGPNGEALRDLSPRLIKSAGQGRLLVETAADGLVALDSRFALLRRTPLNSKSARSDLTMLGTFQWQPVGNDEVVSFSDLELKPPRWGAGFVRFSLADPASFTVLRQGSLEDPERLFNRLGYPFIAALGDKAYILVMGNSTELYESSKGSPDLRRLTAFSSQETPDLPSFDEWSEFAGVMAAVERSAMPAGLYGWDGQLYLLSRKPAGGGRTQWSLTRLDPESGQNLGTVVLPTTAHHLTVIPGPRAWAFLEKGPVLGRERQEIGSMLLVSAARLRGSFSGSLCN